MRSPANEGSKRFSATWGFGVVCASAGPPAAKAAVAKMAAPKHFDNRCDGMSELYLRVRVLAAAALS